MPVSMLRATTEAPGTTLPDGSVRVPVMVAPPATWAEAGGIEHASRASTAMPAAKNFRNRLNSRIICLLVPSVVCFTPIEALPHLELPISSEHQGENTMAFPTILDFPKTLTRQHTRREA